MAGRGTDIVLGEGVPELGGLHILGTERHESRRIDNQLRGRSGRQGDKGSSRFYLSLEDDLLRIFGSDRISGIMEKLGMENGQPIEHNMVSKAVANAQKKVEAHNFDIRKHLLEYDDVMNRQREVFYELRRDIISGENQKEILLEMSEDIVEGLLGDIAHDKLYPEEWDIAALNEAMEKHFMIHAEKTGEKELLIHQAHKLSLEDCNREKLHEAVMEEVRRACDAKEEELKREGFNEASIHNIRKGAMLQFTDGRWKDHLLGMDHMKEGIGLRGYAQKNPLTEYKKEGFEMFRYTMDRIKEEVVEFLFRMQIQKQEPSEAAYEEARPQQQNVVEHRGKEDDSAAKPETVRRDEKKVGRNDPCPCGSGKKYKKCHGS